ncbi:DUF2452 domain-containing protein [Pedobacter sp. SD-b]|uniref:DUF2452 domain-containing protein n=1 Tax=Pedobacter segetis TaxID=2793069 RepID=A0ABS1BLN6_9SPHI|nr:DUF2452 domain-containing protein [Pedobacter segetis]MBK0383761.1 DUF2452 domain-containing protein [Pedobacter segetis]
MFIKRTMTANSTKDPAQETEYYTGEAKFSPVPMSVSSPAIKPIDKNKIRANAVEAMHMQAHQQIAMLRKQAELIMQQVKEIEDRLKISELIYKAEMRFKPVMGQIYHLYEKEEKGSFLVSMIAPQEWGRSKKFSRFLSTIRLLSDSTWDILDKATFNFEEFEKAIPLNRDV